MLYGTDPTPRLRRRLLGTSALVVLGVALYGGAARDAAAAGFALKEQSTAAMSNAFAGATAGAEDVTYMYFNPAGLARHDKSQAAIVLNYIMPKGETNNATTSPPVGGEPNSGDAAEDAFVPAAYLLWSARPDLKFGLGINTPFGLTTKYTTTWAGRFDAVESSIMTVNVNPTVAYRINESLSLGAGLQIQYMDVLLSQMSAGGLAEITGEDWGYGFNLGLLYEFTEATRLGLAYRSRISHELKGDFKVAGTFLSNANADFTAPELVTLGAYHDINEQWAIMGEVQWQGWSTFDELRVVDDGGSLIALTPENWKDAWFFSLGATWKASETWTLRGGAAVEQTPVPDQFRTPRLTDADRTWVALGAQYKLSPSFAIDAGYTHIFIDDATINLPDRTGVGGPPALTATYENSVDIISLQGVWRF
ncbi:MAG: outer membrane protein transport protein [Rhodospirillales bacterium]|nr:MAG: outer membrane protein transport protein [Rhodospirillales bacterium]